MLDLPAVILSFFTIGALGALAAFAVIRSHGPARTLILSGVILELLTRLSVFVMGPLAEVFGLIGVSIVTSLMGFLGLVLILMGIVIGRPGAHTVAQPPQGGGPYGPHQPPGPHQSPGTQQPPANR